MEKLNLEFHKTMTEEGPHTSDNEHPTDGREAIGEAPGSDLLSRVSGNLKGTVTIYPDTDLTAPLLKSGAH